MGEGPVRYRKQSVAQGVRRMVPAAMVGLVAFSGALVAIGSASYTAAVPHLVEVAKNAPVGTVSHAAYEALNNSTAELGAVVGGTAPVPVANVEGLREQFGADLVPNASDTPTDEGHQDGSLALQGGLTGLGGLLVGPPEPEPEADAKPEADAGKPSGGGQRPDTQKPGAQAPDAPAGGDDDSPGGSAGNKPSDKPSGAPSAPPSEKPNKPSTPEQQPDDGRPGLKPPLPDLPPAADAEYEQYRELVRKQLDAIAALLPRVEEYAATFVRECRTASPEQREAYFQQGVEMDATDLIGIMRPIVDNPAPNNETCRRWRSDFDEMGTALSLYIQCYYNAWRSSHADWTDKEIRAVIDSAQYHKDYFNALYQGFGL